MNREQIIAMALEAGMFEPGPLSQDSKRFYPQDFAERFFTLAYAAGQQDMREKAASVCDDIGESSKWSDAWDCERAIRALPIEGEVE